MLTKTSTGQDSLFVSFWGKKGEKLLLDWDLNPRSVDQNLCNISCDETKSESWPVKVLVSVLPEYS